MIATKKPKALLIVGAAPGVEEDAACSHWVGRAGEYLEHLYVKTAGLSELADIYVSNVVRCLGPKDTEPRTKHYNACRPYLVDDLLELQKHYESVTLLGVGAGAARSLCDSSLDGCLGRQGVPVDFGHGLSIRSFWTDNPANLFTHRNPTRLDAVTDHLSLLRCYLQNDELPISLEAEKCVVETATRHLGIPTGGVISVDIESYGAVDGLPPQRVFNAVRAQKTDGVDPSALVQTVAVAWRDKGRLRCSVYTLSNPEHLEAFRFVMGQAPGLPLHFLGMNTQFDVGFLRADPRTSDLVTRGKYKLLDLGVYNYLHSEIRTERSLKTVSPLLGVGDYLDELNLKKGERYATDDDQRLLKYNAKDAIYTLLGYERLLRRIGDDYGLDSDKLSDRTRDWYSELLWFAVESGESGVSLNRTKMVALDASLQTGTKTVSDRVREQFGGAVDGKGSRKWKVSLTDAAVVEAGLLNDRRLKVTPKTKTISANNENFELLLGHLPLESANRKQIELLQEFTTLRDTVSRYTGPMLRGRKVKGYKGLHPGSLVLNDAVYPSWYIVPGQFEDGGTGGTKQGRIVCRNPGLQNLAASVKECLWTRFNPGVLLESDLSQIELRVAALISGDPVMMGDYLREDGDRHWTTGKVILKEVLGYMVQKGLRTAFGIDREWAEVAITQAVADKKDPRVKPIRQLGKTLNFLILFRGGARKAQETAAKDCSILLPLEVWERIVRRFHYECPVFKKWQDNWVEEAVQNGKCVLPILGQSRLFLGGRSGVEEKMNEVANFPIQTMAANVMISGHAAARKVFRSEDMEAVSNLTIYDAMYTECPAHEQEDVTTIIAECLECPEFWALMQEHYGRTLPLGHETKVLCERTL